MYDYIIDTDTPGVIYLTIKCDGGTTCTFRAENMDMMLSLGNHILGAVEQVNR